MKTQHFFDNHRQVQQLLQASKAWHSNQEMKYFVSYGFHIYNCMLLYKMYTIVF